MMTYVNPTYTDRIKIFWSWNVNKFLSLLNSIALLECMDYSFLFAHMEKTKDQKRNKVPRGYFLLACFKNSHN